MIVLSSTVVNGVKYDLVVSPVDVAAFGGVARIEHVTLTPQVRATKEESSDGTRDQEAG